ncbi:MAG: Phenylalanine 4-monooxygenase [Acidobacteriaceae bacterium]|nr:Phenylalanine 4-monooxygenase [Acidobacteriaceae bacterium]
MIEAVTNELEAFIEQNWNAYLPEQHEIWSVLFSRRMAQLRDAGSGAFCNGIERIGLVQDRVPDLELVNSRLEALTGWRAVPVSGFLDAKLFFKCLSERRFPTTIIVRTREQMDYLPEPDIFHDVFGHVPLHSDATFADFLQRFGAVATSAQTEREVKLLTRLFWFTVEFGLIEESGVTKVYGSGLISSAADCAKALGPNCERRPFSLDAVFKQDFEVDQLQTVLFVVKSFEQLFEAAEEALQRLKSGSLA